MTSVNVDSTFHRFNDFPLEIRLLIWDIVYPARVVHLAPETINYHFCCRRVWSNKLVGGTGSDAFEAEDRVLDEEVSEFLMEMDTHYAFWKYEAYDFALLQSRNPSIKPLGPRRRYKFMSASDLTPPTAISVCKETAIRYARAFGTSDAFPSTWFDFERDTLLWGVPEYRRESRYSFEFFDQFRTEELSQVRHLALHWIMTDDQTLPRPEKKLDLDMSELMSYMGYPDSDDEDMDDDEQFLRFSQQVCLAGLAERLTTILKCFPGLRTLFLVNADEIEEFSGYHQPGIELLPSTKCEQYEKMIPWNKLKELRDTAVLEEEPTWRIPDIKVRTLWSAHHHTMQRAHKQLMGI